MAHEGGALKDGISALIKEVLRTSCSLPPCDKTQERVLTGPHCHLDLRLPASSIVRNKILFLISYPVSAICYSSPNGLRKGSKLMFLSFFLEI